MQRINKFLRSNYKLQFTSMRTLRNTALKDILDKRTTNLNELLDPITIKVRPLLYYSDYIQSKCLNLSPEDNFYMLKKLEAQFNEETWALIKQKSSQSIALEYLSDEVMDDIARQELSKKESQESYSDREIIKEIEGAEKDEADAFFGFNKEKDMKNEVLEEAKEKKNEETEMKFQTDLSDKERQLIAKKYKDLYKKYSDEIKYKNPLQASGGEIENPPMRLDDDLSKVPENWMTDFELYNESVEELTEEGGKKIGTSLPDHEISTVPCGGCGAYLHCKDVKFPGFLPSELFLNKTDEELQSMVCQRCHFMTTYDTCLDVNVHPDEYPKLIEHIKFKRCSILLMVDLTDFPCSVHPRIAELIGPNKRVFIVANKIDLLAPDSPYFFENAKDSVRECFIKQGFTNLKVQDISLISAKTGYGIEELINKILKIHKHQGDLYLIGCTNVGKSTLFNTLITSDLCRSKAMDLLQRATTSVWPGTTLNLLKFPIINPWGHKIYSRAQRLISRKGEKNFDREDQRQNFLRTRHLEEMTFRDVVGQTFKPSYDFWRVKSTMDFSGLGSLNDGDQKVGLNSQDPDFQWAHWCYDTPGTIQPDQILHFLTSEELALTVPSKIITPRTFFVRRGWTLFIAGLGRLDCADVNNFIRATVFTSHELPITMCEDCDADYVYRELLKSESFRVPINNPDRLRMWPGLKGKWLEATGIGKNESCADVVLSNAGWVGICADEDEKVKIKAWTVDGRGIYLRNPSLLPKAVTHRGPRVKSLPIYKLGRRIYTKALQ